MTPIRTPSRLLLTLCLACCASLSYATGFDVPRLMQLLAATPEGDVAYREQKFSALLDAPIESSGTLVYRRPDTVEKHQEKPRSESFRIVGEELIVQRKGAEKRFPLSSQPLLAAFAASLRGVLGGDADLLQRHYQLSLKGDEPSWTLEMSPLDASARRYIDGISVNGQRGRIVDIEIRERSGDRSLMQIEGAR